jgi:hypothetical protein
LPPPPPPSPPPPAVPAPLTVEEPEARASVAHHLGSHLLGLRKVHYWHAHWASGSDPNEGRSIVAKRGLSNRSTRPWTADSRSRLTGYREEQEERRRIEHEGLHGLVLLSCLLQRAYPVSISHNGCWRSELGDLSLLFGQVDLLSRRCKPSCLCELSKTTAATSCARETGVAQQSLG